MGKAAEVLGLPADLLGGLLDAGSTASAFVSLDDPVGLALFGGATALDGLLSGLDAGLEHIAATVAPLSDLGFAISAAIFALGAIPVATATAIANAAGFATSAALIAELTALGALLASILAAVNGFVRGLQASIDMLRSALDVLQYVHAKHQRTEALAAGDFARAEAYRDLMRGNALSMLQDWLNAAVNGLLTIPFAGTAKKTVKLVKRVLPADPGALLGAVEPLLDALADTAWWNDAASLAPDNPTGMPGLSDFADPLRAGTPFVDRPSADLGPLSAARRRTIAALDEGWASIHAEAPAWHQALVDDIADPALRPGFDEATSPTFWIGALVAELPMLAEFVTDGSLEGIAAGCDLAASALPAAQPVLDAVALAIADLKPQLDPLVVALDAAVQRHALDLTRLEATAAELEAGLAELRALADPTESVRGTAAELVAALESLRVDPATFALPPWAPVSLTDAVVAPLNAAVDAGVASVRSFEEAVITGWEGTVTATIDSTAQAVATFRAEVSEGGSFHTALQAEVVAFQATVARAKEAFVAWDGVLELDAGAAAAFLQATAAAAREAAAQQGPDADGGGGDPWPAILRDVAVPAIEAWRRRHAAEVEQQYHPAIPPWELEACAALQQQVAADPNASEAGRAEVEAAWAAVRAFEGRRGRAALFGFWSAEQDLVAAVARARAS